MENVSLVTVAAATVGCGWLGFFGYLSYTNKHAGKTDAVDKVVLKQDLDVYDRMIDEVAAEKTYILNKIEQILSTRPTQAQSGNSQTLFSEHAKQSIENLREKAEITELVTQFYKLINSYPKFSAESARKEPDYVKNIQQETIEHHNNVKIIAEEYFRRVDFPDYQQQKSLVASF